MKKTILLLIVILTAACGNEQGSRNQGSIEKEGRFRSTDGVSLHFEMRGQGTDTLVVIHGGPGMDSEYLIPDLAPLEENHILLFYDQRGGGQSTLPQDTSLLHMAQHIQDLEALRQQFGFDKMKLVAHSFGAALAAEYALTHPGRVEKMVFLGPVPPMREDFWIRFGNTINQRLSPEEREKLSLFYTALLEGSDIKAACRAFWSIALKPRLAREQDTAILKGNFCAASPEAIRYGMGITNPVTFDSMKDWDYRPKLPILRASVLIIHGMEDAIPMDMVEEWEKAIPDAELLKVPRAAHFPYVERPEVVWPAIEAFLK